MLLTHACFGFLDVDSSGMAFTLVTFSGATRVTAIAVGTTG